MSENENESVSFQYWDEMTPEEQEQNDLEMWTGKLPDEGGPESVIKYLPLDATAVHTTCGRLRRSAMCWRRMPRYIESEMNGNAWK